MTDYAERLAAELAAFQKTHRSGEGFADGIEADGTTLRGRCVPYDKWVQLTPSIIERYDPGVFAKQTKDPARVKICLEHGQVIGRVVSFDERADGLHFAAKISASDDIPEARKGRAMLNDGLADELSVGFASVPGGTDTGKSGDFTTWHHHRARLMEISLVPWGAMGREATVTRAVFFDEERDIVTREQAEAREQARQWLANFKAFVR